jgi:hypothetical protein
MSYHLLQTGSVVMVRIETLKLVKLAVVLSFLCFCLSLAYADDIGANSPEKLHDKYAVSLARLSNNPFQRPIFLDSSETENGVSGDIYAVTKHPFATVSAALTLPLKNVFLNRE